MTTGSKGISFYASLDKFSKLITIAVCLAVVAILFRAISRLDTNPVSAIFSIAGSGAIIGYCLLFRPLNYVLTNDSLIIRRLMKNVTIPRNEITNVKAISEKELVGTVRKFGVGGLFGYFGKYGNKNGDINMYATNPKNSIMIETTSRNVIITPDDSTAFLQQFK
jgi:hypothetical protein